MIPVAFYAPLKPPTHPNPSGDREIARALAAVLKQAGFDPDLASTLRSLDMKGDQAVQHALTAEAEDALPGIVAKGRKAGWRLWITYHNYYKAPDLLGPAAARDLGIPYVQLESTRARKRLSGPWADFAQRAENAAENADLIFYSTQRDAIALRNYAPDGQQIVHLHPFLHRDELPLASDRTGSILAAGMMRPGDKFESYKLIAQTLALVPSDWSLTIAGDGSERSAVEALFAPFGARVCFLGKRDATGMAEAYASPTVFFWPGVNEAIGMVYLEAQAAGIPVLAQNRPGLIDVLSPHLTYPAPDSGPSGLAKRLTELLDDPPSPDPIRAHIAAHHLMPAAQHTLRENLLPLLKGHQ